MIGKGYKFRSFAVCHRAEDARTIAGTEPILAGAQNNGYNGVISDASGDNISALNPVYNEMTAVYWLWKHYDEIGSPEKIVFQQYRRRFAVNAEYNYNECDLLTEKELENISSDTQTVDSIFSEADFAAPYPLRVKSVRKQYSAAHDPSDVELALTIISELTPEYAETAKKYFEGDASYLYNMFAFDRETFFRYAEWIFTVLDEFVKRRTSEGRLFISERLTGVFFRKLNEEGKREKRLAVLFVTGGKPKLGECVKAIFKGSGGLKERVKPFVYKLTPRALWVRRKRKLFFDK